MMLIRELERRLLLLEKPGFQLLSSGEEAVAVGVSSVLGPDDQVLTSGRAIGPALARGLDPGRVLAELLGKKDGPCKGQGGRGHLAWPSAGFFGAHAVVGGNVTIAVGVALAMQQEKKPGVVVCQFGDGACGAGSLHEAMNIAALWRLPIVFVCNNNQYSVSTRVTDAIAVQKLSDLARPFGIEARTIDGMDVRAVHAAASELVGRTRAGDGPTFLECLSFGFYAHSTSSKEARPAAEIAAWRDRCPIKKLGDALVSEGVMSEATRAEIAAGVARDVDAAVVFAQASPFPDPVESLRDVG
jgi:TPP-dependent pyruvate/acetoin dehydrogenase alpha subunit